MSNLTADTEYTKTVEVIDGIEVTTYGGTKRPVETIAVAGHVTGWSKRSGARTTYAEMTCTCRLVGEARSLPEPTGKGWTSVGEEGWVETLNNQARAHIANVMTAGFMARPPKGDSTRVADRFRVNREIVAKMLAARGLDVEASFATMAKGLPVVAEDGARFEQANDRGPFGTETLPIR